MNGGADKLEGKADELKGNIKEKVGDATDDRSLQAEGLKDQAAGEVKQAVGDVKNAVDDNDASTTTTTSDLPTFSQPEAWFSARLGGNKTWPTCPFEAGGLVVSRASRRLGAHRSNGRHLAPSSSAASDVLPGKAPSAERLRQ